MGYKLYMAGIQFPVPPKKIEVTSKGKNKTVTLINDGEVNILKTPGLSEHKFELLLPNTEYSFAQYPVTFHEAQYYLDILEYLQNSLQPFQLDIYRSYHDEIERDTEMTVTLESYSIKEDADEADDIIVTVELKAYNDYGTKTLVATEDGLSYKVERTDSKKPTRIVEVQNGDTIWSICKREFGRVDDDMIKQIYDMNKPMIGDDKDVDVLTYIENKDVWTDSGITTKAQAVALIDKLSGGLYGNTCALSDSHWATWNVQSLENKGYITDYEMWIDNLDAPISKAMLLALVDNWSGGVWSRYADEEVDHWARRHLNTLCDKNIIQEPDAWTDFEGQVTNANTKALANRALMLVHTEQTLKPGQKLLVLSN